MIKVGINSQVGLVENHFTITLQYCSHYFPYFKITDSSERFEEIEIAPLKMKDKSDNGYPRVLWIQYRVR